MARSVKKASQNSQVQDATACPLCAGKAVSGDARWRVLFAVDASAGTLTGAERQLLDKMIAAMGAMGLQSDEVGVVPVVCADCLGRHLVSTGVKVIAVLGAGAARLALADPTIELERLRGETFEFRGTRVVPTYHPGHLLAHPAAKKAAWEDLQRVAKELGLQISR
ncbi:MAG: uracil-DNA glycosylase family protein [Bacteriovoracia bacterium]